MSLCLDVLRNEEEKSERGQTRVPIGSKGSTTGSGAIGPSLSSLPVLGNRSSSYLHIDVLVFLCPSVFNHIFLTPRPHQVVKSPNSHSPRPLELNGV